MSHSWNRKSLTDDFFEKASEPQKKRVAKISANIKTLREVRRRTPIRKLRRRLELTREIRTQQRSMYHHMNEVATWADKANVRA